jgi:hypothetical protein
LAGARSVNVSEREPHEERFVCENRCASTSLFIADMRFNVFRFCRPSSGRLDVLPVKVVSATGEVINAQGVLGRGGIAKLQRPGPPEGVPSVTLDFGKVVVGYPRVSFAGEMSPRRRSWT